MRTFHSSLDFYLNLFIAGILDGDKKKLPKDLDWNDVNFYRKQQEVEAMEERDEWG